VIVRETTTFVDRIYTSVPDTRIMIPNSESPNLLNSNRKQQGENGVYTPVYTNDSDLEEIVKSWEGLPHETRMVISYLVKTHRMI